MSNNFTSGMAGPAAVETLNLLWDRVTEQIAGNSTTSLAIGTGTKTLTIEASKQFAIGQTARITYNSDVGKWMQGTVSAYNATTGEMTVVVDATGGSGTYAAWTVALAASPTAPQVGFFATEALGRAAVTDGSTFRVQGSGDAAAYEYQRINSGASTLLATYAAQPALANGYRLKKINPGVNLFDVESLVSEFALSDTGVVQARAVGKMFTPIPVTAGQTYTLSGKAGANYQSRDTVAFYSYAGASPIVMADFVAGATLVAYTQIAAGLATVPTGATHIAINADFYYGIPAADIKTTYRDFMLQAGTTATLDPTFQKAGLYAHQRPMAALEALANYKNYNANFGLDLLTRDEETDFYRYNEYRSATSRTYYDFIKPVTQGVLKTLGVNYKVGFEDATEGFLHANNVDLYRRVGIRVPLAEPIKKFANQTYNYLCCTFFVEANPSAEVTFFTGLNVTLYLDTITGPSYAVPDATDYGDVLYAPSADTTMTIGKLYTLGGKTVRKLEANLYEVTASVGLYAGSTPQTAYITAINFLVGNSSVLSVTDPAMFYVSGLHVYKKELEDFVQPRASYALPYPRMMSPLRADIIKAANKADAMAADQRELLSGGWYGKTIVWLGTSVPNEPPYGESGTLKYPEMVAAMTGARVQVRAYGGSIVTWNPGSAQYGLAGSAADFVAASHAQSSSEVAWDTALSGLWDADLFVFDHMHNDAGLLATLAASNGGVLPAITGGNEYDRTWAVGAMNYVIREIYRRNPRARIAIINDYRAEFYWNKTGNQMVADYWGLPIMNPRMAARNTDIVLAADITYTKYDGTTATLTSGSTINPLKFITKAAPDEPTPSGSDTIHLGRYGRILFAKQVVRWMRNELTPQAVNADYL